MSIRSWSGCDPSKRRVILTLRTLHSRPGPTPERLLHRESRIPSGGNMPQNRCKAGLNAVRKLGPILFY